MHFTGLYWPGDDKDAFQQISLTHPLTVNEPSPNPLDSQPTDYNSDPIDIIDIIDSIFHNPNYLKPIIFFLVMLIYGPVVLIEEKNLKNKSISLKKIK